jgi:hypothetical protein
MKQGRGMASHHVYRTRIGLPWSPDRIECLDPRQGGLDFLAEGDTQGRPALAGFANGRAANQTGSIDRRASLFSGDEGAVTPASLLDIVTLEFDVLNRWFGETRRWRVYVIATIGVPKGLEREIEETYPYAEEYALALIKVLPQTEQVIVAIDDLTTPKAPFAAWRAGKAMAIT